MGKGKALTLAVFTAWPFLYMILFMCTIFGMIMADFSGGEQSYDPSAGMMIIFILHFFTIIEIMVLLVIYLIHVFRTDRVPQDKKALWAVVLFLGHMISMPVYWYLYIWKEPKTSTPEG